MATMRIERFHPVRLRRANQHRTGLGADVWEGGWDAMATKAKLFEMLASIEPEATRAENELQAWGKEIAALITAGVATRNQILEYNDAANQVFQANWRTRLFLVEAGWKDAPEPAAPPVFGTERTIATGSPLSVPEIMVKVPEDAFPTVEAIYDPPWWERAVKKTAGVPVRSLGRGLSLAMLAVPLYVFAVKALVATAVIVAVGTTLYVLLDRADSRKAEHARLTFKQQQQRDAAYGSCMGGQTFATVDEKIALSNHCLGIAQTQYPPGSLPGPGGGLFDSILPIVQWAVVGTIAVVIVKAVMFAKESAEP